MTALATATQRRCFVLTHGECGAGCVRQAVHQGLGCEIYVHEVTAETESKRGQSIMVRALDLSLIHI
eukprot:2685882-Alexandrium_andersonii.AAC.1